MNHSTNATTNMYLATPDPPDEALARAFTPEQVATVTLLLTEAQRQRAAGILRTTAQELEHMPTPSYSIVVGNLRSVLSWLEDCLYYASCSSDLPPAGVAAAANNNDTHTRRLAAAAGE